MHMPKPPAAFLSYVRLDDKHERGRLSEFRERLSGEVRIQTGEEFPIFQDREDIHWGQEWKSRIKDSLASVTFLIPILTPGFFKSQPCRDEMELFLKREKALGRDDLIMPVHYVNCAILSDKDKRAQDHLAEIIATRNIADWRDLRHEPMTSALAGRTLDVLASHIRDALERGQAASVAPPVGPAANRAGADKSAATSEQASATPALPTPKTEPPTLVVDALHRGDHTTLTAALAAAAPGTRILVRPGHYREGITIDKPVEIIGEGAREDIVLEATDKPVVLFTAPMGRIANLTLRQGGGKWFGVDIAQGRLDLEDCDITSRGWSCVAIHAGADPRLRRNVIRDSNESGVAVYDNGQGTLEDNDIFGNALSGIAITTGGNPIVRRNRIHDGRESGVYVHDNGQGTLEDNDVFGNAGSGVAVRESGAPALRGNRITKNGYHGIRVYDGGAGSFYGNDLRGNVRGAWNIAKDCLDKVTREDNQE
jgi:parallel beta-helix repeat protein